MICVAWTDSPQDPWILLLWVTSPYIFFLPGPWPSRNLGLPIIGHTNLNLHLPFPSVLHAKLWQINLKYYHNASYQGLVVCASHTQSGWIGNPSASIIGCWRNPRNTHLTSLQHKCSLMFIYLLSWFVFNEDRKVTDYICPLPHFLESCVSLVVFEHPLLARMSFILLPLPPTFWDYSICNYSQLVCLPQITIHTFEYGSVVPL